MALVKIILGLGAVVLFMPTDKESQTKVYDATAHAVERVATFCTRNPETCQKGGEYWAVFKQKAEFGAKMAWTLAADRMNTKSAAEADTDDDKSAVAPVKLQRARTETISGAVQPVQDKGTLTTQDLRPGWRIPSTPVRRGT